MIDRRKTSPSPGSRSKQISSPRAAPRETTGRSFSTSDHHRRGISLSPAARAHLALRRTAEETLARGPGAMLACGEPDADTIALLCNLGRTWGRPTLFTDGRARSVGKRLTRRVDEQRSRGYWCRARSIEGIEGTLAAEAKHSAIAVLVLVVSRLGLLPRGSNRLIDRLVPGGTLLLDHGTPGPKSATRIGRKLGRLGLVEIGSPYLSAWSRSPVANPEPCESDSSRREPRVDDNTVVVLCYPHPPAGKFAKMCQRAGYRVTTDPTDPFDVAIKWYGETYTPNDPVLAEVAAATSMINIRCVDISKVRVEALHREIFGYGCVVDPETYHGRCVRKANLNALCHESVVDCPLVEDVAPGFFVYQKLIPTAPEPEEFEEYRVPITGCEIPCVVIKRRPLTHRFNRSAGYASLVAANDVFSTEEQRKILRLCAAAGLEFGDIDILRDRDDGKLHIIDLNPTPGGPGGPGGGYTAEQRDTLIATQLEALQRILVAPRLPR